MPLRVRWLIPGILTAALACGLGGCRSQVDALARFVPDSRTGRQALTAALDVWKKGEVPGTITSVKPHVVVVDHHRRPDQVLDRYEVLGETADEHARVFTVRLTLSNPAEQPIVRFAVLGIDPLWVFRQEDYEMIIHWEHPMGEESAEKGAPTEP